MNLPKKISTSGLAMLLSVNERTLAKPFDEMHIQPEIDFYSTVYAIGPDGLVGKYRATHLWDAEREWGTPGGCSCVEISAQPLQSLRFQRSERQRVQLGANAQLASPIGDFCNKIGTNRTCQPPRPMSAY